MNTKIIYYKIFCHIARKSVVGPTKRKLNDEEDQNKRESKVLKSSGKDEEVETKTHDAEPVEPEESNCTVKKESKSKEEIIGTVGEEVKVKEGVKVKQEGDGEQIKTDTKEMKEKESDKSKDAKKDNKASSFFGIIYNNGFINLSSQISNFFFKSQTNISGTNDL